jgi:hypothetical protein
MHSYASFVMNIQPSFESFVVYSSHLGRAAHLGRQLVDGLRRDGAVLVGHICVLLACFFFSRAGTFEMHQAENVLECVKFYMPQDQFPGIAGERYSWFVDITPPPPSGARCPGRRP